MNVPFRKSSDDRLLISRRQLEHLVEVTDGIRIDLLAALNFLEEGRAWLAADVLRELKRRIGG